MSVAALDHPAIQKLLKIPPKTINYWVTLVITVVCIFLLSQLTWHIVQTLLVDSEIKRPDIVVQPKTRAKPQASMRVVANSKIFGEKPRVAKAAPKPVNTDAPLKDSKINAKLRAVYVSSNQKTANATIELNRGAQEVVFVGETFGSGVELLEVHTDKIIISNRGNREAIKMEDFAPSRGGSPNYAGLPSTSGSAKRSTRVMDKRNDRSATRELRKLKEQLMSDPSSVADLITGQPFMKDGQFAGFKIRPGKNRRLFSKLGLRRNDVVTSINGTNLDNPQTAMTMMGQIGSVEELSVTVLRGEEEVSLQFSLAE